MVNLLGAQIARLPLVPLGCPPSRLYRCSCAVLRSFRTRSLVVLHRTVHVLDIPVSHVDLLSVIVKLSTPSMVHRGKGSATSPLLFSAPRPRHLHKLLCSRVPCYLCLTVIVLVSYRMGATLNWRFVCTSLLGQYGLLTSYVSMGVSTSTQTPIL